MKHYTSSFYKNITLLFILIFLKTKTNAIIKISSMFFILQYIFFSPRSQSSYRKQVPFFFVIETFAFVKWGVFFFFFCSDG